MVLDASPIRKLHVGGRSRRHARFPLRKHPLSTSLHRGLSPVGYDFALVNGDELVSYTIAKPRHAPVRYYTHANHLYSVAATTNTAGAVVERYSYNAYGVRTVKNSVGATLAKSAINQDRGFTSYKLDSETGLYYARSRMYSAKLGRFASQDQWRLMGRDKYDNLIAYRPKSLDGYPNGLSLYNAYFSPNKTDSLGEDCEYDCRRTRELDSTNDAAALATCLFGAALTGFPIGAIIAAACTANYYVSNNVTWDKLAICLRGCQPISYCPFTPRPGTQA